VAAVKLEPELEPASDKSEGVELPAAPHTRARACASGVEVDGALELVHGGGEIVRAKVRLEVREVVDRALAMRRRDHECRVRADFARHSAPRRFDSRDEIGQGSVLRIVCL
jgi:hypothetical protein